MSYNDFEYTKQFDVNSSWVNGVFYNENDDTVVLDLDGEMYLYSDVTPADVADLVGAASVGAYYNSFWKHEHGPSESLGYTEDLSSERVPVVKSTPGTHKGLYFASGGFVDASGSAQFGDVAPTKEYSLAPLVVDVDPAEVVSVAKDESTKEFSLAEIDAPDEGAVSENLEGANKVVVHFTLEAYGDKTFKFVASEDNLSVDAAIDELNAYVSRFGGKGRVRKVVVKFV